MATITIIEFCKKNGINWFPIYLELKEHDDGVIEKKLESINHPAYEGRPKQTDFHNLSQEKIEERQSILKYKLYSYVKHIAMDTSKIFHIDIDVPKYDEGFDEIAKLTPYFKSTTKSYGKHILIQSDDFEPSSKRMQFKCKGVELLSGQWSYAPIDGIIYNADKAIMKMTNIENELTIPIMKTKQNAISEIQSLTSTEQKKKKFIVVPKLGSALTTDDEKLKDYHEIKEHGNNIHIQYLDSYDDWLKIIWSLKSHDISLYEYAKEISLKSKKYDELAFDKFWDVYDLNNSKISIGTFYNYSKISNKEAFIKIKVKYNPKSINEVVKSQTTENIARCFYDLFGGDFIYNNKTVYYFNGVNWETSSTALRRKFTKEFTNVFIDYNIQVLNEMKNEQPEGEKYRSLSDKSSTILNVIKSLQTNKIIKDCCNDSIPVYIENKNVKFEINPYMFCFNNVVYDLQKDEFIDVPNRDDFMTLTTGYDYRVPKEEEIEKLNELFCKVFPIADERKLYLTLLSTGLFGTTLEKFILANGGGRNGKGFTNELALEMFGNYGYTCANSVLLSAIKDGANQSIANMNNRRFIVYREPDTDTYSRLNTSTVKELTGGSEINARGLYESNTKTNLKGTHILECNQKPKMSGDTDDAIIMRIIDIGFRSTFTNKHDEINEEIYIFKGDDNVKSINFKENHKHALFHILLDHWKEYKACNLNIDRFVPLSITQRGDKYLQSSDEIYSWFIETYQKVDNKYEVIQLKDVFEYFRISECYSTYNKKEKRECNQSKFFEKIEKHPYLRKHYKERLKDKIIQEKYKIKEMRNVLIGFKKIEIEIKVVDNFEDLREFEEDFEGV